MKVRRLITMGAAVLLFVSFFTSTTASAAGEGNTPSGTAEIETNIQEAFRLTKSNTVDALDKNLSVADWLALFCRVSGISKDIPSTADLEHNYEAIRQAGFLSDISAEQLAGLKVRPLVYQMIFDLAGIKTYPASHYGVKSDMDAGTTAMLLSGLITSDDIKTDKPISYDEAAKLLYQVAVEKKVTSIPSNLVAYLPVTFECKNPEDARKVFEEEAAKIPNNYQAQFIKAGYQYVVMDNINDVLHTGIPNLGGIYDWKIKTVFLNAEHIAFSLVHETGHYASNQYTGNKGARKELFSAEAKGLSQIAGSYCTSSDSEFFAEAFRYIVENQGNEQKLSSMKKVAPKTYEYMLNTVLPMQFDISEDWFVELVSTH